MAAAAISFNAANIPNLAMKDVDLWWKQAEKDFEVANSLYGSKHYYASAFFCHQSLEKALKALFMSTKSEKPSQTHSLVYLGSQLGVEKRYFQLLKNLTTDFIAARYPDITDSLPYENYSEEIAKNYVSQTSELLKWIKVKLPHS